MCLGAATIAMSPSLKHQNWMANRALASRYTRETSEVA